MPGGDESDSTGLSDSSHLDTVSSNDGPGIGAGPGSTIGWTPGASGSESPAHLRPGDVFAGRYRIVSYLGKGGFSYVFKAEDTESGQTVALKFLSGREATTELVERMRRELRLARDLRHPNIVRAFDLHELGSFYCLAMEFVEGKTLKEVIHSRSPLPHEEARSILLKLSSALAAVHAAGIVHRDLKPQNVMVTPSGEVKLLDFGLARTPGSTGLTTTGTIMGTPDYMSPEQVDGRRADTRSDVYSLGVIAYELFAGDTPFHGDTALAVALQHVRSRVPPIRMARPDTPASIDRLVQRTTERDPARRPASAQAVLAELEQLSVMGPGRAGLRSRPRRALVAAAGIGLLVVAGFVAVVALRQGKTGEPVTTFADGQVETVVAAGRGAVATERFLVTLAESMASRIAGPRIRVRKAEDEARDLDWSRWRSQGVEHVVLLRLERSTADPSGAFSYAVSASVIDTADGREWRRLSGRAGSALDFAYLDDVSQHLADQYVAAVNEAITAAR